MRSYFNKDRFLFSLALLAAGPLFSQESKPDSSATLLLEEVGINSVRALPDQPVTATTISRKSIEQVYTGQDAAFLLERLTPAIVTFSESGTGLSNYGQMRLRGIDQTRINITLNGVPLNDMIDQGVFFSNIVDFGNSLESVQVQRGVGTSSNGVASYAGSVNFESPSLTRQKSYANLQLTGGSFNTFRTSAEVATGLQDNGTSFYARVSHLQSDGYRYHTGTRANSMFFSGGYFGEKHAFKFTGLVGRSKNDLAYTPVALSDIENDPRTNYISENDIDDFGQWLTQLQHTWRIKSNQFLATTLYYGGAGGDFPFGFSDSTGFTQINYPLYNHHFGLMSNYNWQSADNLSSFNAGVHAYTFRRQNIEFIEPDRINPYYDDRSQKDELSVFAKWSKKKGAWELLADVQLRTVSLALSPDEEFLGMEATVPDRNFVFLNPKVGLSYNINSASQMYFSFGRSGREPTRFDILGSTQINSGNLALAENTESINPEFVNDFELGFRRQADKLQFQANLFYMIFENEIAPIGEFIPEGFVQVYRNQESSYRAGLEVELLYKPIERLSVNWQAAYLQANISSYQPEGSSEVFNDITPILSPEVNTRLAIDYRLWQALYVGVDARYLSASYIELTNNSDLQVPESLVFNANVRWRFWNQHEFSLVLNNLTDALYYTYGVPSTIANEPAFFVQPPRHFYASLTLRF